MIQVFGTTKCKVTRAAQRYMSDRAVPVQFIDLRQKGLSPGELQSVARAVGGIRRLYDAPKDKTVRFAAPTEGQLEKLLLEQPLLLVTPIVRRGAKAFVGDNPEGWAALVEEERA